MSAKLEFSVKSIIAQDDVDAFISYYEQHGDLLNTHRMRNQNTFAHWAAAEDAIQCLAFMSEKGFDLTVTNADKSTLLWFSVMSGAMDTTKFLLEKSHDPNEKCERGQNVIFALASLQMCQDNVAMLDLLISYGAIINLIDNRGCPLIVFAGNQANPGFLAAVLPYVENINATDAKGKTALDFASLFDNTNGEKAKELLIKNGAKCGAGFHENEKPDGWTFYSEEPAVDEDQ